MDADTIRRAVDALTEPLPCCSHVVARQADVLTVCVLHPAGGVRCAACAAEHVQRHEGASVCASCGEPLWPDCVARDVPIEVAALTITHPRLERGEIVLMPARVHLVGIVQCGRCAAHTA